MKYNPLDSDRAANNEALDLKNKKHKCKELKFCTCDLQALEPDEDCPMHGYRRKNRCRCGRFC